MSTQSELVEKAPHIDEQRMRHISDADLFAALDLSRPGLGDVQAAVDRADWTAAYGAWHTYFQQRREPHPVTNLSGYATYLRAHDPHHAEAIVATARQLWPAEIDFTDRAKGKSGLYGFHYMYWMEPLIEAYAIDGDERHVSTFVRLFNQWYEMRDKVHGEWPMDVVWYTLGLSIRTPRFARAYHTFRQSGELDERTVARLLKTILGAARWLAEEHDTFRHGNWQHHGVTGLFELATFWPEFREAPDWAALAWQRLLNHLELDVYADGGHLERAPSYHAGVLDGYQRVALAAELNWSARLQDQPRFPAMYHWLMAQCTPLGVSTNFNDSGPVWVGPYLAQGAVVCGDPELKWVAERLGTEEEIGRTLSKLPDRPDGKTAASVFTELPSREPAATSLLLPSSKFAIMRGSWDQDDLYLAVSYGPLVGHELESHSHLDPLSFIVVGRGRPLAIEAGCPASYDDPHYHDWYQAAQSHNLVIVDGSAPTPDQKDGQLLHWSTSPVADIFQATHDGYRARSVQHRRTIVFLKDTGWLVHDELLGDGPHHYAWQIFSPTPLQNRDGVFGPNGEPGLVVQPILAGAEVEHTRGIMVVPGPAAYEGTDERREVEGLRLVRDDASPRTCFFVLLTPSLDIGQEAIGQTLPVLSEAGEAATIETGHEQTLVAITASNQSGPWRVNDWMSDARVWLSRSDGAWVVCDGSQLTRSDTPIVTTSAPVDSMACWPTGNGWSGEVTTRRRTTISLGSISGWSRISLNGVTVPTTDTGGIPSFLVPAAGTYRFRVE